MEKYIYKITNKINNKIYIGQTNNPKRRWQEHLHLGNSTEEEKNPLYLAMKKYGSENFSFEILEGPTEQYNEREIYWIKFYNSCVYSPDSNGYNLTEGRENPPIFYGEFHHYATHSNEEIQNIKNLLKNTKLSTKQIAKLFNYTLSSIDRINNGLLWHDETEEYPLRKEISRLSMKERAEKIKYDLLNTTLTQKQIGEKYGVGRTTITAINQGQNYFDNKLDYPLRKTNQQNKVILMYDFSGEILLKEYPSIQQACKDNNITNNANIIKCAQGKIAHAYGHVWRYKEK